MVIRSAAGILAALALVAASWAQAEPGPPLPIAELPAPSDLPSGHAPWPVRAEYTAPTDRYPHGILGRVPGWGSLVVDVQLCSSCSQDPTRLRIDLPVSRVFEDLAPRLWDVTGDGRPEIVVIESDVALGARLVVWEAQWDDASDAPHLAVVGSTPFIGTRFRWLAPIGAADFTGDGVAEIAYIETPHLNRVLRLVTLQEGGLAEIAHLEGVTNHAIGEEHVDGEIRLCGSRPEIVVWSGDRSKVLVIYVQSGELVSRVLGSAGEPGLWERARDCGR